jgi:ABC transport system ATP-binding/permease protein
MELVAKKIFVELGGTKILQAVDFVIRPGELIGILGPSGSGKSTLLMALAGFRPVTEGRVVIGGQDLYENFETVKSEIGFVPQDDIVPTALRVGRVLAYAAELRLPHIEASERSARVDEVVAELSLADRVNLRVSKLSGGQRKRVSVGVELLSRPAILFADEPTSGLDPALERTLTETFRDMTGDDRSVVVTTHVMTSLDLYDHLAVIVRGRLAYFGPPGEMKPYFGVTDYADIYRMLENKDPVQWHDAFQRSAVRKKAFG